MEVGILVGSQEGGGVVEEAAREGIEVGDGKEPVAAAEGAVVGTGVLVVFAVVFLVGVAVAFAVGIVEAVGDDVLAGTNNVGTSEG